MSDVVASELGRQADIYIASADAQGLRSVIDAGFDMGELIRHGRTALHLAAELGNIDLCRMLIERGAQVNFQQSMDEAGTLYFAPLHFAAARNATEIARLLLSHGANANAQGPYGITPLHSCLKTGGAYALDKIPDMVGLLLEHGADPNAVASQILTSGGWSVEFQAPLHLAVVSHSSNAGDANFSFRLRCFGEAITQLIAHGGNPSIVPEGVRGDYLTPLQDAVKYGRIEHVELLLAAPLADLVQKTLSTGRTLVQLAGKRKNVVASIRAHQTMASVHAGVESSLTEDMEATSPVRRSSLSPL